MFFSVVGYWPLSIPPKSEWSLLIFGVVRFVLLHQARSQDCPKSLGKAEFAGSCKPTKNPPVGAGFQLKTKRELKQLLSGPIWQT
jgi:hypothetical protein